MLKRNNTLSLIAAFLILSLFCSLQSVSDAQASNASVVYCPNPPPELETGENTYSLQIANIIDYYIQTQGDFQFHTNEQGSSVTRTQMGYLTHYCETNHNFATVFYKGHSSNYICVGGQKHSFLMDYTGQAANNIQDAYIWTNTILNRHDFVFLWTCGMAAADMFPGGYCSGCGGGRGMCYSWMKITGISSDGYNYPTTTTQHVFLGFNWSSPNYKSQTGYLTWDYGGFAAHFYKYVLEEEKSVNQALDSTSWLTMNTWYFDDTPLYEGLLGLEGQYTALKVFGNGNRGLPTT
ncbi:MAG: hypothetical protein ACFCUE_07915 [Candidatus Bathyarchaeia archaeon]